MTGDHFEHLFVFGRPAGGKSEFIDFVKKCDDEKRRRKFHIAPFEIIDDYLFLRSMAEDEDIFEKLSVPVSRKMTERTEDGIVVLDSLFWDFVSEKISKIMTWKYLAHPEYYSERGVLIEFARGVGLDGYKRALTNIRPEILQRGAALYIKCSYEEALRRNEARYQEKLKHSILAHKVPVVAMERFYRTDDWAELTGGKSLGFIEINGVKMPFVTMENEPESNDPLVMEGRYETALEKLYKLR